jgi:protein-tyrosine-phosphatase
LPTGDPAYKAPKGDFAPRIGFAYDVFGNGKTAIHGYGGLFYMPMQFNLGLPTNIPELSNYNVTIFDAIFANPPYSISNPSPNPPSPTQNVTIFPQESQQALEQAYDIARRVINGDARPKELNAWMTGLAKGELTGEALADCSELLVTMALENGYREGEKGYNLLVALMRMLNDKELPPIIHDRIARSFERYISARVESWTAAVEEAYREMATTQAVGRLERLYSALYDDLDDIRQLNEIQVLQTPVLTYLENGLETFHTKAVNKERRIVEDIIGKAGTLAERELSEKNLQELRKALRLAKQNGLLGETRRILLVGAGNYGRSPMAELFLKQMLAAEGINGIEVHSRGLSIETGRDEIAKGVSQALLRNKVRGPSHTARALTSKDIEQADLVLSMDSALSRQLSSDRVPCEAPEPAEAKIPTWPRSAKLDRASLQTCRGLYGSVATHAYRFVPSSLTCKMQQGRCTALPRTPE